MKALPTCGEAMMVSTTVLVAVNLIILCPPLSSSHMRRYLTPPAVVAGQPHLAMLRLARPPLLASIRSLHVLAGPICGALMVSSATSSREMFHSAEKPWGWLSDFILVLMSSASLSPHSRLAGWIIILPAPHDISRKAIWFASTSLCEAMTWRPMYGMRRFCASPSSMLMWEGKPRWPLTMSLAESASSSGGCWGTSPPTLPPAGLAPERF